jgi:hypothetical protein
MSTARLTCLLGGIGLIVGAFLPWANARGEFLLFQRSETVYGHQGDGVITGGLGLLIVVICLLHTGTAHRSYSLLISVVALVAGAVILMDMAHIASEIKRQSNSFVTATMGAGLYVTLISAVLACVGGIIPVKPMVVVQIPGATTDTLVAPAGQAETRDKQLRRQITRQVTELVVWGIVVLAIAIVICVGSYMLVSTYPQLFQSR